MLKLLTQTVHGDAILWGVLSMLAALLFRWVFKGSAYLAFLGLVIIYLTLGVGLVPAATGILFLFAAGIVGRMLFQFVAVPKGQEGSFVQSTSLGVAAYILVWSLLIDYPVNSWILHTALILMPVTLGICRYRRELEAQLKTSCARLNLLLQGIPYWQFSLGLLVIGWVFRFAFMPTVGHDDNVLHLRIWTELTDHQYFNYDLKNEIWSLAPNLVDVSHAVISLVAGSDARGAINLILGLLLCGGLLRLLALSSANATTQWLILVLFVSTPLFAYQLTTLQTELMLAVLLMIGANLSLRLNSHRDLLGQLAIAAVCAMSLATKMPGLFIAGSIIAMALAHVVVYGNRLAISPPVKTYRLTALLLGLAALAATPYVRALIVTGNPVFPLMNGVFKSPYFEPINFADMRYVHGASLATYWDMFFNTSKYNETHNYTAGIQYLFLAPLSLLLACVNYRKSPLALLLIPVLVFGGFMFSQIQYLRYLFPVMPLLSVVMIGLITLPSGWLKRFFIALIMLCIAFNLAMVSKASWYMNIPMGPLFTTKGKQLAEHRIIPEKAVNDFVSERYPGASVLYVNSPFGASLHGKPITLNWHAPENYATIRSIKNHEKLMQMLEKLRPEFIMRSTEEGKKEWQEVSQNLIREHLVSHGYPVFGQGNVVLYQLTPRPIVYQNARSRDLARSYLGVREASPFILSGDNSPNLLDSFNTEGKRHLKYSLILDCRQGGTVFNAQINWDNGPYYFRPVKCEDELLEFNETLPIPPGASYGDISLSARHLQNKATVKYLNIGLN